MKGIKKKHRSKMSPQINSQGPLSDRPHLHVAGKSNIALIAYKPSGPSGQILSHFAVA